MHCDVCTERKFVQTGNREPYARAKSVLELVHTDLAGPIGPESIDCHKYAISFTDYTSAVFVYFLKYKSDVVQATEKFLADTVQNGRVKRIRSDNALEFMSKNDQAILSKDVIKHERSAPYSPHQNGTAEQNWCTLFDMARCVLIENQKPKRAVDLCSTDCIYGEEQVF